MRDATGESRPRWHPRIPSLCGLAVAAVFFWLSFTPSLLPVPWLYQGLATGVCVALGYAIGAFVGWVVRALAGRPIPKRVMRWAWLTLAVAGPIVLIAAVVQGHSWLNEMERLVQMPEAGVATTLAAAVAGLIVALVFVGLARLVRDLAVWAARLLGRWVRWRAALAIGWVLVALLLVFVFNGVVWRGFVSFSDSTYSAANDGTAAGAVQPQSPERSGSSASLVSWQSLGKQGRSFVGRGPTQAQLSAFDGTPAKEPIRVYAGLESAPSDQARADLVVKELDRTGAWTRAVLVVATPTGTGWLEPQSVDSLEYEFNGDTAIASMQYSYLPSWISQLVDKSRATEAGKVLFAAVWDRWSQLPAASRPRLIAYGLSLGSYGGQAAFGSVTDLKAATAGALFLGTPNDTALWSDITAHRDASSPEWLPVYGGGATVRFAASAADLGRPATTWSAPRVLYLQHASDPVVWWSPKLFLHEPDWLKEPRGPDVSPSMRWFPIVTFAQVSVDQFVGTMPPNGHGHNYANMIVAAWASVLSPPGWTAAKTAALEKVIDAYPNE